MYKRKLEYTLYGGTANRSNTNYFHVRILCLLTLICLVMIIFTSGSAFGQNEGGPKTVSGRVYKSNGEPVDSAYNGAHVELHIIHNGIEIVRRDHNGIESDGVEAGWYSITLQAGEWSQGDIYWIIVNGESWGDINGRAEERNYTGVNEWRMVGGGSHQLDIKTAAPSVEAQTDIANIEPEIAVISGIVILLIGLYLMGPNKKVRIDVIVISRKIDPARSGGTGGHGLKNTYYELGYGDAADPIKIGRLRNVEEHLAENAVVRVKVNGIVRLPDGTYKWYKPELIGLEKPGHMPLLAPDSVPDVDKLWYASGSVKIESGQSIKNGIIKRYLKNIAGLTIPFVALEFFMGFYSFFNTTPTVPPWLGEALIINLVLIVMGIIGPAVSATRSSGAKRMVEINKKDNFTIRQWAVVSQAIPGSQQTSGQGRLNFCSSCQSQVLETASRCQSCGRTFVSSIEITPAEAQKLMGNVVKTGTPAMQHAVNSNVQANQAPKTHQTPQPALPGTVNPGQSKVPDQLSPKT